MKLGYEEERSAQNALPKLERYHRARQRKIVKHSLVVDSEVGEGNIYCASMFCTSQTIIFFRDT